MLTDALAGLDAAPIEAAIVPEGEGPAGMRAIGERALRGVTSLARPERRYVYTATESEKRIRNGIVPIGQPSIDRECALIGEAGERVPAGETDEISFRGPQITKGYLHDAVKAGSAFVRFDWDATGARWYRNGGYWLFERRRQRGVHRPPRQPDQARQEANQIVVGRVAFITITVARDEEARIRGDSGVHLVRVFFPKKLITIDAIPVSPSGKTDRKALAALAERLTPSASPGSR